MDYHLTGCLITSRHHKCGTRSLPWFVAWPSLWAPPHRDSPSLGRSRSRWASHPPSSPCWPPLPWSEPGPAPYPETLNRNIFFEIWGPFLGPWRSSQSCCWKKRMFKTAPEGLSCMPTAQHATLKPLRTLATPPAPAGAYHAVSFHHVSQNVWRFRSLEHPCSCLCNCFGQIEPRHTLPTRMCQVCLVEIANLLDHLTWPGCSRWNLPFQHCLHHIIYTSARRNFQTETSRSLWV